MFRRHTLHLTGYPQGLLFRTRFHHGSLTLSATHAHHPDRLTTPARRQHQASQPILLAATASTGLVRPVDQLHGLPFFFRLQARLAGSTSARRNDSRRLSYFLRYLLSGVCEHAMCLPYMARFRCHHQRHSLTRASSHVCARPVLARRLYSYHLSRFCCQR